jgi:hypothetical protein
MTVDNVMYVLRLTPTPRALGWSRGPDTPFDGNWRDWPALNGVYNPDGNHTFHWLRANGTLAPDSFHNFRDEMQSRGVRHLKNWPEATPAEQSSGLWLMTDLTRLMTFMTARGFDAQVATINARIQDGTIPINGA